MLLQSFWKTEFFETLLTAGEASVTERKYEKLDYTKLASLSK